MAVKAKTSEKKTTATKAASAKKTSAKKYSRGQELSCEVCGLAVTVDDVGGLLVEEDSLLLCCDKPMKARATKKAAKK